MKCGFVSLVGRPNVGKSTLLNSLLGMKLAITSNVSGTTRNVIQGIYNDDTSQIIFVDTPGIHKPTHKLGTLLNKKAYNSTEGVDIILFLVDISKGFGKGDEFVLNRIKDKGVPVFLLLNKIDQLNEEELFDLMKMYNAEGVFEQIVPISALKGRNINELLKVIKSHLEEGPQYFPDYMITDQPERVLVSELIREKVLHYIHDEVPHGVAVEIERMKSRKDKEIVDISAVIYCERDSHKGIIIGKNGRKLKGIGKSARADIELLLGSQANLQLWVKVKENWRNLQNYVSNFGYTEK